MHRGAGAAVLSAPVSAVDDLRRARAGDRAAFADLVRAHQSLVFSIALRMLGDRDAAEDMAQDVFIQLHDKLSTIESDAHLKAWLRRAVSHRCIDQIRRRTLRLARSPQTEPSVDDAASDHLLQQRLRELLLQLAPAPRAVMVLRYQEDLDPQEIADTIGMPINTVKSHLKRSLTLLRERLSGGHSTEES